MFRSKVCACVQLAKHCKFVFTHSVKRESKTQVSRQPQQLNTTNLFRLSLSVFPLSTPKQKHHTILNTQPNACMRFVCILYMVFCTNVHTERHKYTIHNTQHTHGPILLIISCIRIFNTRCAQIYVLFTLNKKQTYSNRNTHFFFSLSSRFRHFLCISRSSSLSVVVRK